MKRYEAIEEIVNTLEEEILISSLGYISRDLFRIIKRDSNFYMLGSMGLASSIGLGVSLHTDRGVWVIEGDGSILMNLGSLSTISNYAKPNFCLIVLDDSCYSSSGNQQSHTKNKTRIGDIAEGCGFDNIYETNGDELNCILNTIKNIDGTNIVIVHIESDVCSSDYITLHNVLMRDRFMEGFQKWQ